MTSALVRMALVVALIERMSFPAMSGAASIAHMPKCERSSSADIPRPTSSMSGSFQWPGPAYWASALSMSMRPVNDPQLALMSNPMRHMLHTLSSSTEQLGGHAGALPVDRIDAVENRLTGRDQRGVHRREAGQRAAAIVVLQIVDAPRREGLGVLRFVALPAGLARTGRSPQGSRRCPASAPCRERTSPARGCRSGTCVVSHCRFPLESRPFIQQSSMLTYWYPTAAMPLETNVSATPLIRVSLGLHPKVFHEFQPMGGVAPTTCEPALPPAPPVDTAPPAPRPAWPLPPPPPVPVDPPVAGRPPDPEPPAPPVPICPPVAGLPPVAATPPVPELAPPVPVVAPPRPVDVCPPLPPPVAVVPPEPLFWPVRPDEHPCDQIASKAKALTQRFPNIVLAIAAVAPTL